jgi:hypothetical protein
MELSEIEDYKEISRWRIPAPLTNSSYCEKNWMPVVDMPYHFVKWSNPTELVKVDPIEKTCTQVHVGTYLPQPQDYRGGSQVIPFDDYRIAMSHTTYLYKSAAGKKNGRYRHSLIVWDKNWNVVKYAPVFSFLDADIEFCCGMTEHNGDFLLSFGLQDNAAFLLRAPRKLLEDLVYG